MQEPDQAKGNSFLSVSEHQRWVDTSLFWEILASTKQFLKLPPLLGIKNGTTRPFFMIDPDSGCGCEQNLPLGPWPESLFLVFVALTPFHRWIIDGAALRRASKFISLPQLHVHRCSGSNFSCAGAFTWRWWKCPTCSVSVQLIWRPVRTFRLLQDAVGNI